MIKLGEHYRDLRPYKYQLTVDYLQEDCSVHGWRFATQFIELAESGKLAIFAGYAWDGPSGPTFDTDTFMRGSLVHDALYQCLRMGLLPPECRIVADKELRRICLEDGMCRPRAWWVYRGVRLGGRRAARRQKEEA